LSQENPWSLFGIDLSRLGHQFKLGIEQLLWSPSAGLRSRWYPAATLSGSGDGARWVDEFGDAKQPAGDSSVEALELPEDLFLLRYLELPEAAEMDLDTAVSMDIAGNSPFPAADLCSGWRITERHAGRLRVAIVMASRAAVHQWLHRDKAVSDEAAVEVWAPMGEAGAGHVVMSGFAEGGRYRAYIAALRQIALRCAVMLSVVSVLFAVPALYTGIRANQLEAQLAAVTDQARTATQLRERLSTQRESLDVLADMREQRVPYHFWLNSLATMTPDSVYFSRLQFEKREGEISGFAGNAAEFLGQLAESERFDAIEAPGAFTRDRNNGLERFTITLTLPEAAE
jgi:Tfp pilus assembly protein PilN